MRWLPPLLVSLLASGSAFAAMLPFEAELSIRIGAGAAYSIGTVGSGVASVNGAGELGPLTSLALRAGFIATPAVVVPITDPAASPIYGFKLSPGNGPGNFAIGGDGHLGGVMPLSGALRVCLFADCAAAVANLSIPLTPIGAGGSATVAGNLLITVVGAPWTTGTVMDAGYRGSSFTGSAQGPASAPDSTARPGGRLLLVTPISLRTNISADGPIPGFAFLTLHFVPEPTTALLVMGGLGLVAAIGRRRMRA